MAITILIIGILCAIVVFVIAAPALRERRRQQIRKQPFPQPWEDILRHRLPIYDKLPQQLRSELQDDIKIFLAEKEFVGCGGLELDNEIRITIAAQASILTLGRRKRYYPKLISVCVYPSAYVAQVRQAGPGGTVTEGGSVHLGESWGDGRLVLAWDAARHGAVNIHDGRNVVFHEFAHRLDQEDGTGDGVPFLQTPDRYADWVRVLGERYEQLQKRKRTRGVISKYGATNPAEFFATATEAFFEKPHQMRRKMPDLYEELKDYYTVDPAEWQQ